MADTYKFRIDHHGSLVRPAELLDARRRHAAGELAADGLRQAEDRAVAEAVRTQRRLSLTAVTDGEFRREDLRDAVFAAVSGFRRTDGEVDGLTRWVADDELKAHGPLVADDVAAVATQTVIAAKATLPSPAYLAAQCFDGSAASPWGSARELGEALARIIRDEIEAILARGVRYIQLDNHGYAPALSGGTLPGLTLDDAIAIDSLAVGLDNRPADARIGLCPAIAAIGPVDVAVAERLFAEVPVDRWLLPYDKGAAAEVALLRAVPAEKDVCLGIVDPSVAALEDIDTIMGRMDVAFEVRDLDDVAVSPSAGFAPRAGGATIGAEDQRRKLIHVETIARMCWGNEL
jgi:5-methyltetrahydropteroyltriglutamate--homocysteine methyltransferase